MINQQKQTQSIIGHGRLADVQRPFIQLYSTLLYSLPLNNRDTTTFSVRHCTIPQHDLYDKRKNTEGV